jgi:hypothetical protein
MQSIRPLTIGFLLSVLVLVAHRDLSAQVPSNNQLAGRVVGSIQDRFGERIQEATVVFEAKVDGKKIKRKTKSDREGAFDIFLPHGIYNVSINFVGFRRFRNKNLLVAANKTNALDIVLEIDPKKSVTVNAGNHN